MFRMLVWLFVPALALGAARFQPAPAVASAPTPTPQAYFGTLNLTELRDAICHLESRPLKHPELAAAVNRNGTADLGMCQINITRLQHMGYLSTDWRKDAKHVPVAPACSPVLTREGSKQIALEILLQAAALVQSKGWRVNAYNVVGIYAGGEGYIPSPEGKYHKSTMQVIERVAGRK